MRQKAKKEERPRSNFCAYSIKRGSANGAYTFYRDSLVLQCYVFRVFDFSLLSTLDAVRLHHIYQAISVHLLLNLSVYQFNCLKDLHYEEIVQELNFC